MAQKEARFYQTEAVSLVEKGLIQESKKRVLVVLPTGAGKTLTSKLILSSPAIREHLNVGDRPLRVLFLAHNTRLLRQAAAEYADEPMIQIFLQSTFTDIPDELVEQGWDVTVMDEAHHEAMHSVQIRLERISSAPLIGLTATPIRADGMMIKFDKVITPLSRTQAVDNGYLAKTYLNTIVDVGGSNKVSLLKEVFDNFISDIGQTLLFVRTKAEVRELSQYLNLQGIPSVALLDQSDDELDNILKDFEDKKVKIVINCNRIAEGVDVKGCDTVILGRQYGSYAMINQVIGRAARPDSDCNVWQLANPLKANLDAMDVVGEPETHQLYWKEMGEWFSSPFSTENETNPNTIDTEI